MWLKNPEGIIKNTSKVKDKRKRGTIKKIIIENESRSRDTWSACMLTQRIGPPISVLPISTCSRSYEAEQISKNSFRKWVTCICVLPMPSGHLSLIKCTQVAKRWLDATLKNEFSDHFQVKGHLIVYVRLLWGEMAVDWSIVLSIPPIKHMGCLLTSSFPTVGCVACPSWINAYKVVIEIQDIAKTS